VRATKYKRIVTDIISDTLTRNKFLRIHMKNNKGTCYGVC